MAPCLVLMIGLWVGGGGGMWVWANLQEATTSVCMSPAIDTYYLWFLRSVMLLQVAPLLVGH
eukprot:scaffold8502_cov187-Isochrysis_galbana.AAC.2